jgi:hypothetical protein
MRRQRDLTPWPLATPEQARQYTVEYSRTTAGSALFEAGVPLAALPARLEIRLESIRVDPVGEATGIVWTRLDGGPWIREGGYLLSKRFRTEPPTGPSGPAEETRR